MFKHLFKLRQISCSQRIAYQNTNYDYKIAAAGLLVTMMAVNRYRKSQLAHADDAPAEPEDLQTHVPSLDAPVHVPTPEDEAAEAPNDLPDYKVVTGHAEVSDLLSNLSSRLIFLANNPSNPSGLEQVQQFGEYMGQLRGLNMTMYQVDVSIEENKKAINDFLDKRGKIYADQRFEEFSFILGNKYNDVWMQEPKIIKEFQEDVEYFYKFFEGPKSVPDLDFLLASQSGLNDINVVTYVSDPSNLDQLNETKSFRMKSQMNQTNTPFHVHYWMITDEQQAKVLGIDTSQVGDVYVVRKQSIFTDDLPSNIDVKGYKYVSEKLMTKEEAKEDMDGFEKKIMSYALNKPIVIKEPRELQGIAQVFGGVIFLVYCDESDPSYDKVLRALCKCRGNMPIDMTENQSARGKKSKDILFVLSKHHDLFQFQFKQKEGPQAFVSPKDELINVFETHIPKVKILDDIPKEEWIIKARNSDKEFEVTLGDSKRDIDLKESKKRWYDLQRFIFSKQFKPDQEVLTDPVKMQKYLDSVTNGQEPYNLDSVPLPQEFSNIRQINGNEFEGMVFTGNKQQDKLVLITHPNDKKNMGISTEFDKFAKMNQLDGVIPILYPGINESEAFKVPQKLPSIVYFKKDGSPVELDRNKIMTLSSDSEIDKKQFQNTLKEFLKSNKVIQ